MLAAQAPAKINLCLHVAGRRSDGYHALRSLVAFADIADRLSLDEAGTLGVDMAGPTAKFCGSEADNLVLKAARNLAAQIPRLRTGRFRLEKRLPVAAGLGGGSADAAAALRLLGALNGLAPDDPRLLEAARLTGADVPVCLDGATRIMHGIGHDLDRPLRLPPLAAVLVNCSKPVATAPVFAALGLKPGDRNAAPQAVDVADRLDSEGLIHLLAQLRNDLEPPAIAVEPAIAVTLDAIRGLEGIRLARMSALERPASACSQRLKQPKPPPPSLAGSDRTGGSPPRRLAAPTLPCRRWRMPERPLEIQAG